MPVERHAISTNQLCELLGVDPARFVGIDQEPHAREDQRKGPKQPRGWVIVLEGEAPMTQTRGTNPPLYQGKGTKKGGGKKKC